MGGATRATCPPTSRGSARPRRLGRRAGGRGRRLAARWRAGAARRGGRPAAGRGDGLELRAAAAIASALAELAELAGLAPRPAELAARSRGLEFRVWSGPVEGRVRIADPYRLRAARFDHVFVASLQDGEFPRRARRRPFLSEAQRESLGLEPRRDTEAEERYLFYACLALPAGASSSPTATATRTASPRRARRCSTRSGALLAPPPGEGRPGRGALTRGRDLAEVVHPPARRPRRPSWRGRSPPAARAPTPRLCSRAPASAPSRRSGRGAARAARGRPRPPPARRDRSPTRRCSRRSRGRRLRRHDAGGLRRLLLPLVRLPRARPAAARPGARPARPGRPHARGPRAPLPGAARAATRCPAPARSRAWIERGRELVAEVAAERELGEHPAERAMRARVERAARPLPRRGGRARDRRLRALAARGGLRRGRGGRAAGARDRRLAPARRDRPRRPRPPTAGRWSSTTRSPARSRRARSSRRRRSCSCSSTCSPSPSSGARRRSAASTTRCAGTSERRPRGLVLEEAADDLGRLRPVGTDVVDEEEIRGAARRGAARGPARSSRGCGPATSAATRARGAGLRGHDVCPRLLRLRADLPARPRARRAERGRGGGGAVSERAPTPEQAAAIEAAARDVMVEAGAGTGKTGVMVDRYCRLVCEEGVAAGRDPRLHLHREGGGRAAAADPGRAGRPGRRGLGARAASCSAALGGAWVTTIHGFCNRLLAAHPVAAGIDPRFRVLDAPEAERAAREAFDEALEEFLAGGDGEREETVAAYEIDGLRGDGRRRPRRAAQPRRRRAAAARAARARRRRRRCAAPPRPPPRRSSRAEAESDAKRELLERAVELLARTGGRRASTRWRRCGRQQGEGRWPPTARRSRRRSPRVAEAGEGGAAYRHLGELLELFSGALRGGQGATRRARLRGPAAPRRAAARAGRDRRAPTAAASATCWSTSSRTPTGCSCG